MTLRTLRWLQSRVSCKPERHRSSRQSSRGGVFRRVLWPLPCHAAAEVPRRAKPPDEQVHHDRITPPLVIAMVRVRPCCIPSSSTRWGYRAMAATGKHARTLLVTLARVKLLLAKRYVRSKGWSRGARSNLLGPKDARAKQTRSPPQRPAPSAGHG